VLPSFGERLARTFIRECAGAITNASFNRWQLTLHWLSSPIVDLLSAP